MLLSLSVYYLLSEIKKQQGGVAQMVERSLSMREVRGSIPPPPNNFAAVIPPKKVPILALGPVL
jgi:hypothetical protein